MKSKTYLNHHSQPAKDSWNQVKPGNGAYVQETSGADELKLSGIYHDMSVLNPEELISRFEDYEDINNQEEWLL